MASCMKFAVFACLLMAGSAAATGGDPIAKVIGMIDDLKVKIEKAGEAEEKAFKEFFDWCDDAASEAKNGIKTASKDKSKQEATIAKAKADIEDADTAINELAGTIAKAEEELAKATALREKEAKVFAKAQGELVQGVGMLDRAIQVISGASASLLQKQANTQQTQDLISSVSMILDAAAFSTNDQKQLAAFLQSRQQDDDSEFGAPAAASYESKSGGIVDVLEDMKDKAEGELSDLRKAETAAKHNYEMLKQSLVDQIAADTKDKEENTAKMTEATETQATADGDLAIATKDLKATEETLHTTSQDCMTSAQDHEESLKGREEELKALATATKIIKEATGAAAASFLQLKASSRAQLKNMEVVAVVKKLAKAQHSLALQQLASRISATMRLGGGNSDVFAKVKELITKMIAKLQKEAEAEASAKAYCDEETKKNTEKNDELTEDSDKLTAKIDKDSAKSAELKSQVEDLQGELAAMAKLQGEMDKTRADQNAAYKEASGDLEKGINGIQGALDVLREYYGSASLLQQPAAPGGHESSGDAGGAIISMLEVAESDFSKELAALNLEEETAQEEYDKVTEENKMTKLMKDQDVKYKTIEYKKLDKEVAELSNDLDGVKTELSAVTEYGAKLADQCTAKPDTYEDRKKRRDAEINGLKDALEVLESETAFVQRPRRLRRVTAH